MLPYFDTVYSKDPVGSVGYSIAVTVHVKSACKGTIMRKGCMSIAALNYDAMATLDDGTCIVPVYGCLNPAAVNFGCPNRWAGSACDVAVTGVTVHEKRKCNYAGSAQEGTFNPPLPPLPPSPLAPPNPPVEAGKVWVEEKTYEVKMVTEFIMDRQAAVVNKAALNAAVNSAKGTDYTVEEATLFGTGGEVVARRLAEEVLTLTQTRTYSNPAAAETMKTAIAAVVITPTALASIITEQTGIAVEVLSPPNAVIETVTTFVQKAADPPVASPTPPTSPPSPVGPPSSEEDSTGAIVGGVVGGIVALLLIAGFIMWKRKKMMATKEVYPA